MLIIRPAKSNDAQCLAQLAQATFKAAFSHSCNDHDMALYCESNFTATIQLKEILDTNIVTLLVFLNNELVGFAQVGLDSFNKYLKVEQQMELKRIYFVNKYHGSGLASKLMTEIHKIWSNSNAQCIWLGVWEDNSKAIAFYHKYGFRIVGEHIFQLGQDPQRDLIMALNKN